MVINLKNQKWTMESSLQFEEGEYNNESMEIQL